MSLDTGTYIISIATNDTPQPVQIGRAPIEDLSLLPKAIYALPTGIQANTPWIIQKNDDGSYTLRATHATIGTFEGRDGLFALLIEEIGTPLTWVFKEQSGYGPNAYSIVTKDGSQKWRVGDENTHFGKKMTLQSADTSKDSKNVFTVIKLQGI